MKRRLLILTAFAITQYLSSPVASEVINSSPDHYHLQQKAESTLAPMELWQRLIQPSQWWHPDHTYSGDANNLQLDLRPGGLWQEIWGNNSVVHGRILLVLEGEKLRLEAPFGPLQELAVTTVWTISITPKDKGSMVVFDERASGSGASKLDELAKAVDFVKSQAIGRLVKKPI